MTTNPRQNLYLEISKNLLDRELTDLREYVIGANILSAGLVEKANAHKIFNQLEKEQKLKPGDLNLLADLLRKIGRHDYAEKAEKITKNERKGKKTRKKRKRKRKREHPHEEDSAEDSSSMGNYPHVGHGLDHSYLLLVAKEVGPSWVKFTVEQLGLTAEDVVNIQLRHPSSTEHQALQALELWRDRRGRKACRVKLAQALRRGGFQHTAELSVQRSPQGTQKQKLKSQDQTLLARSKRPRTETDSVDGELSIKEPCRRNIGSSTHSPTEDASSDENNDYFTLLKMSKDVFHPGNVRDPDKFEKAVSLFRQHAETVIGTDSESEGPKLEQSVKLRLKRAADRRVKEVHKTAFTTRALRNLQTYDRIVNCFKQFKAIVKRLKRGCVLCYIDFDDTSCYRTFLAAYRDGRLSETLTRELITDDMRAAEGEDLYVHVTLLGEDGDCQDDSPSDEEEPRGPTEGSKVGSTAPESPFFIKQEPLSPVKPEPPQDLPSSSYPTEAKYRKTTVTVSVLESQQPLDLKTELINRPPPFDFQRLRHVKAEPHFHVKREGHLLAHKDQHSTTEMDSQIKTEPRHRVKTEQLSLTTHHHHVKTEHRHKTEQPIYSEGTGAHPSMQPASFPVLKTEEGYKRDVEQPSLITEPQHAIQWNTDTGQNLDAEHHMRTEHHHMGTEHYMGTVHRMGTEHHMDTEPHPHNDQPPTTDSVQTETETGAGAGDQQEETDLMHQAQQQEEPFCYHCYYQLLLLADRLGPYWTWLALQLGFTSADVERISCTYHPSYHPHWCLWEWVQRELWGASVDAVLVGLRTAGLHQIADELETGALFQKDVDDGSWGSEWKDHDDKGDGSSSDGDSDDDGDSGGVARKTSSRSSATHGEEQPNDRSPDDTDREASVSGPGGSHSNVDGGAISQEDGTTSLDSVAHIDTVSYSVYPTGEDALAWHDCLQDFFKTDEDTTRSIQQNWPNASQVTKLDLTSGELSWQEYDVPLPITAINLLVQFLPQLPNLQELALCVSCQGEEEAEHINQLYGVRHVLKKLKLKDWSLSNIRLSTQMFQHLPLLEEIDLSHNNISDQAVPGLAKGLGSCQNLRKVDLSHNKLSYRGDFLPPLPSLEEIDLSLNIISDETVPGLAEGLGSFQNLKKVNLSYNKLSDVRELTAAFINLPNLTRVDIVANSIRDESLPTIAAWLKVRTDLKIVDLRGNRFSAEGVRDFVRTMKRKAYRWGIILYDGSQADVGEAVESGGEDVRREEQQWERLREETSEIRVEVGQLWVWINHKGPRSNNPRLKPFKVGSLS
uniref:Death domain-containing protein n=1 Tax=Branchiostoma floridae TaxID=7739 RepID=C3ZPV1_BRAFL|eukprot:XP_002589319.1 hypothetical protein BRAFLDRAFT_77772 [Branchiostoma floridae]